ncbi:histidinol-phosphate transaminase [Lobosporangium transversale]|uniref:histidinol-phosphate transaminase n=1 Tax=Lobosporangium transversale TaxID=64571 RepID=A0A1Y2GT62_9FUNG|nr:histidinol-phosphate aminotransferase [Lobosporangium transversale]KAF9897320.1 histidinol-phosphate transaminase [Lobosporangium transversale]ORZ22699.1 histidinol-phosphate aminotransferase [Lobosporangium transversale]|eukprot:XP_021883253.1 histidinol-phosphate aminotransferase [Lobosporangium transversale]
MAASSQFSIKSIVRPNILALKPYRCARDDYSMGVLLDANENAYGPALNPLSDAAVTSSGLDINRYPDPHQHDLKNLIAKFRNIPNATPENFFLGVGSDEVIDMVFRVFCVPGKDAVLITPPTYGMYSVCAQINDVEVHKATLTLDGRFQLNVEEIEKQVEAHPNIKAIFLCSPGNPTGSALTHESIRRVLTLPNYKGVVVVDEAYVDFIDANKEGTTATWVNDYPNLIVMQTMSKSFGLAGVRLGVAITTPEIAHYMNATKAPYNIASTTSRVAQEALQPKALEILRQNIAVMVQERTRLLEAFKSISGLGRVLGTNDANFVLVEVLDKDGKPCNERAHHIYTDMAKNQGLVVRFRGTEIGCEGCLRITVGTPEENDVVIKRLTEQLSA